MEAVASAVSGGNLSTTVDVSGMTQAHAAFEDAHSRAVATNNDWQEAKARLGTHWHGDASNDFGAAMAQWEENFNKVIAELNRMTMALSDNTSNYNKVHSTTVGVAGQTRGAMGQVHMNFH